MRALRFTGPASDDSRTEIVELPDPSPGPGELGVDVRRAGINFKDVLMRRGDRAYVPQWPIVPGIEIVGTVSAVGTGVEPALIGTRVVAALPFGGLVEKVVVPAPAAVPVPDGVSDDIAAAIPLAWTTAELLLRRVRPGERTLLVHSAAGGVGQALAALAPTHGRFELIGAVGDRSRIDVARAAGYSIVLVRGEDLDVASRHATVDTVFNPLGAARAAADIELLRAGGQVVLFGNATGQDVPLPALATLLGRNVGLTGLSITSMPTDRVVEATRAVLGLVASGAVRPRVSVLDGLEQASRAHDALAAGRAPGKYVVTVS